MNIYVTHSMGFDYQNELYAPLRNSVLNTHYTIILPHEASGAVHDSKISIEKCDIVIAEVSYPSTGQGIELGWANMMGKRIIAIYRKGTKPSSSIRIITDVVTEYGEGELIAVLKQELKL